jgi:hypothetical protein
MKSAGVIALTERPVSVVTSTCLSLLGKTEQDHIMDSVELIVMTKVHARMRTVAIVHVPGRVFVFQGVISMLRRVRRPDDVSATLATLIQVAVKIAQEPAGLKH